MFVERFTCFTRECNATHEEEYAQWQTETFVQQNHCTELLHMAVIAYLHQTFIVETAAPSLAVYLVV